MHFLAYPSGMTEAGNDYAQAYDVVVGDVAGDWFDAAKVYEGMTPLMADDVADCIAWAATRPPHVNIDEIVVRPRDQARAVASMAAVALSLMTLYGWGESFFLKLDKLPMFCLLWFTLLIGNRGGNQRPELHLQVQGENLENQHGVRENRP